MDERLQQRVAVELQPELAVDVAGGGPALELRLDAARRGGDEVGAEHVLERPARLQRLGRLASTSSRMRSLIALTSSRITRWKRSRVAASTSG